MPRRLAARRESVFDLSTVFLVSGVLLLLISVPGACGQSDDEMENSGASTASETPTPAPIMEIVTPTPSWLQSPGDGGAVEDDSDGESLPSADVGMYVVQPGDTLFGIATRLGLDLVTLAEVNGITDPASIQVGQLLVIPGQ